jgi:hypothetical protein
VQLVAAFALSVVLRAGLDAGTGQASAEAELEALLATATPKSPPAEVLVVLEGPDSTVYRLEEVTVQLDGTPTPFSTAADGGATSALLTDVDGGLPFALATVVDAGAGFPLSSLTDGGLPPTAAANVDAGPSSTGTPISDGEHVVSARLVYRGQPTGPYPWQQGPRWVLPARVAFQASHGLRFNVRLVVEMNLQAPAAQRLVLHSDVEPEMLLAVDDAPLPPPPRPRLPPVPTTVAASMATPVATPATPPPAPAAKKRPKKKVARASQPTGAVPVAAKTSKSDALEEATARLRSALAAPADAGALPAATVPH